MEGGRDQEVRLEGPSIVGLTSAGAAGGRRGFHHQSFDHDTQALLIGSSYPQRWTALARTRRNLILELQLFKSISPLLSVAMSCRLSHSFHRCRSRLALLSVRSVCCWGSLCVPSHSHWRAHCTCMGRDTNRGKSIPLGWIQPESDGVWAYARVCGEWTWEVAWYDVMNSGLIECCALGSWSGAERLVLFHMVFKT